MPTIKLESSDKKIFVTDIEVAKCIGSLKTMLENFGDDENDIIPLASVNSATLHKVLHWAEYHKDDPEPTEDDKNKEKRTVNISSWDADFLKVDQSTLFELITAANYLDIKSLLDASCQTLADMIKGKSPEEICKTFNIENDFTPDESKWWKEE